MIKINKALGQVTYNDGDFAEIDTTGLEGIEIGLYLDVLQINIEDTNLGVAEFQRNFRVGTLLDIETTHKINPSSKTSADLDELHRASEETQRRFELGQI